MKRLASVLLILCAAAAAQAQMAPAVPLEATSARANAGDGPSAPSYSDLQCAGFVTRETFPKTNYVVAGWHAPHAIRYSEREVVYFMGSGYTVGTRYNVVRSQKDPNLMEIFPGQNKMLNKMGNMYADIGRARVIRLEGEVAVAEVEFTCEPMVAGDVVIPLQEKPEVVYKRRPPLEKFAAYSSVSGRVVMGKGLDQFMGNGQKFYANIGATQGLKPGDYVRITRNYDPKRMAPIDSMSLEAPGREDTQKDPVITKKRDLAKLPYRAIGEGVVLYTTPDTSTIMITNALQEVHLGDVVETIAQQ